MTGHMGVYPLMYDLVAETAEEKDRVRQVIIDVTSHIVDNGFVLIGEKGTATLWGRWDPITVNSDPFYYDGRGLNAAEILGYLSVAYRITNNASYLSAFNELVDQYHYSESAIGAKITQASDVNYSDDELAYIAYFTFLWSGANATNPAFEKAKTDILVSVQRTYKYVAKERSSWWSATTLAFYRQYGILDSAMKERLISDTLFCLQTWPTSFVTWPTDNSGRLDIELNPHTNDVQAMESILPYDEITLLLWNGSPFDLKQGSGHQEQDPSAWLLPYWLGRYLEMF